MVWSAPEARRNATRRGRSDSEARMSGVQPWESRSSTFPDASRIRRATFQIYRHVVVENTEKTLLYHGNDRPNKYTGVA